MRTSVSVPDDLLERFDEIWEAEGLENRSRAVREAMAEYVESHTRLEAETGSVVALVSFDYRHADVIADLHAVQHDYQDVIQNTSHTHQGEWCLEAVFCRGTAARIRDLTYQLRDFDDVRRVTAMTLAADAVDHDHHS